MNWLLDCWQVAALPNELGTQPLARRLCNRDVVMYRASDRSPVAFADACPHRLTPLSLGRVRGDHLQCGYHGLSFAPDGRCVGIPGQELIPASARVRSYPIVERRQYVWIWLGNPDNADPATVPDLHCMEDPAWTSVTGYHHVNADYRLLADNLLDLTHTSFVHEDTLGKRLVAEYPHTVKNIDDREVRVYRMMLDCDPSPIGAPWLNERRVDRWHETIYQPPGLLLVESGNRPAGARDDSETARHTIVNLVTPENATSCHYFWAAARDFEIADGKLSELMYKYSVLTFDADVLFLEGQQCRIGDAPEPEFPVAIRVDAGPTLARRLLNAAIAREQHMSEAYLPPSSTSAV